MKKTAAFILSVLISVFLYSPASFCAEYEDGIYTASHSFVRVEVVISSGEIESVELIEHGGGGENYRRKVEPITEDIVLEQRADVETVTGATVSSRNVIEAVKKALEQAEK